jgi:hypothetical protein
MECQKAIDFVNEHKPQIISRARKYAYYAPYDDDDFIQDAYEAAVMAWRVCANNRDKKFYGLFWKYFQDIIAAKVPCPDVKIKYPRVHKALTEKEGPRKTKRKPESDRPRRESMSIPSNFVVDMESNQISAYHDRREDFRRKRMAEIALVSLTPNLTAKETEVIILHYGLTIHGGFPLKTVNRILGYKDPNTAKGYLDRALKKAAKLINSGKISKSLIRDYTESENEFVYPKIGVI